MKTTATVRVRVVVGVVVPTVWAAGATVEDVRKRGVQEAEALVRSALEGETELRLIGVESLEMTVVSEAER